MEGRTNTKFAWWFDFRISGVTVYSSWIRFAVVVWNREMRRRARQERRCWQGGISVVLVCFRILVGYFKIVP